jgi:uncharacterized protein
MRSSLVLDRGERTFVVVFDKGDEVIEGLTAFAGRQHLRASHLTAIGALREVTLGFFDPAAREYRRIPLAEQVEVLSLLGVITLDGEKPKVHAHIVVGRADGSARGGHLLEGARVPHPGGHRRGAARTPSAQDRSRDRPGADRPRHAAGRLSRLSRAGRGPWRSIRA